jgi:hypothetical protein
MIKSLGVYVSWSLDNCESAGALVVLNKLQQNSFHVEWNIKISITVFQTKYQYHCNHFAVSFISFLDAKLKLKLLFLVGRLKLELFDVGAQIQRKKLASWIMDSLAVH